MALDILSNSIILIYSLSGAGLLFGLYCVLTIITVHPKDEESPIIKTGHEEEMSMFGKGIISHLL